MSKRKQKKYVVMLQIDVSGYITVKASSKKQAIKRALEKYNGIDSLEWPSITLNHIEDESVEAEE